MVGNRTRVRRITSLIIILHLLITELLAQIMSPQKRDRLCGLAVRHSLRDREVRSSIPGRVKPRCSKLVLAADSPGVWHYGFSATAKTGRSGIMWLGVLYARAPYITVWQHAFNCPKRRL
ncbi:hypothetical protein ElyMa_005087200 [Elysia marginata]|uniref:Secreted protein n=1 Tax=Elysia marginata TaxID=1093978 RepID=A0AAV4JHM8_9GAST|nr:hypothetical protein ElyMa_005087200 [Elysia marginata]